MSPYTKTKKSEVFKITSAFYLGSAWERFKNSHFTCLSGNIVPVIYGFNGPALEPSIKILSECAIIK